jgi:2-polyprenyl-3-methyl-5-hydroxy-6-metoxy-1,4-benzoquinol methylase
MSQKVHWEQIYSSKPTEKLGWYEPHLHTSLSWIKGLSLTVDASMIDVGGGASTLVDDLLDAGYRSITVLDISEKPLSLAKTRSGKKRVGYVIGGRYNLD